MRKISLYQAEINLKRARLNYSKQKKDLIYDIKEQFFSLLKAKKRLEIARDAETRSREIFEMAKAKYRTGLFTEMDLLREKLKFTIFFLSTHWRLMNPTIGLKISFIGKKNKNKSC